MFLRGGSLRRLGQGFSDSMAAHHYQRGLRKGLFSNSGHVLIEHLVVIVIPIPVGIA